MAATRKFPLHSLALSLLVCIHALSEQEALLRFKNSVKDPTNTLVDWSTTAAAHHCNWTGVSCTNSVDGPLTVSSLNLQSSNLSGEISPSLCALPHLAHLNLAGNLFDVTIPLHLSDCKSLIGLNLSNNLVRGEIPEQIPLFPRLEFLDFSGNRIEGNIPVGLGGALRRLKVLNLGSNLLSGGVRGLFGNFTELAVLDLSRNRFYGELGIDLFQGLGRLRMLDLSGNNLGGVLPKIDFLLPNLVSFDVSQNVFSGPFPGGVCEAKGLSALSLSTNFFNGSIADDCVRKCENLERFEVQNNAFDGDFPALLWSLPRIKLVRGENNRFGGRIPDSIAEATQLEHVQIDNNSFTAEFPFGVGKVETLYRFSASLNGFYGELPPNFCDSPAMSIVNLSHNLLSGKIPEVKNCRKLVSLSLANNSFVGEIPVSLGDLPVLTYLDLSQNNLSGLIPQELEKLKLAMFNVSFNRLSGRVPTPLVLGLPSLFLQGNPDLCGPGLSRSCLDDKLVGKSSGFAKLTCALVLISIAFLLLVFSFIFYVIRFYKRKSRLGIWRSVFFYPLRITQHDLIMAMGENTARGRGGALGRVYVVNLPSGELVALKKIVHFCSQSSKALKKVIKTLAKIRHKNVAKILGFCHSDEAIFLIYEYLPRGSLNDLIGETAFDLPWSVRLKIAIGVARGLAYLHRDYVPNLLSRNVKSSNVVLDNDFEPKLTDFALDRIVGESAFRSMIMSECSLSCYLAPEYGHTKKATEENDTYSFGVVLLELLTGRQAEEYGSGEEEPSPDVVKWVRRNINITDGPMRVLDPKISNSAHEQMTSALDIALHCTSVVPEKRPSMCEVVKALQSLESSFQGLELSG